MMRFIRHVLPLLLCAALLLPAACGEQDAGAYLALLPAAEEGETLILPAYPVPDHVLLLLQTAQNEIGYTEERSGFTKYGDWAGDPTAEWCAEFLCWCVHRVDTEHHTQLLDRVYPNYSGTNTGRNWFLREGRYIARKGFVPSWGSQWYKGASEPMEKNSYIPQPGDWAFLSDNAEGDTSHVALVEYCTRDENGRVLVHVIEGNNVTKPAPQGVARNVYPLDYWKILGYGTVYDLADIALRFGNKGVKVKALQQALVAAGLLDPQYTTGQYGAITETAIRTVQRMSGIAETGIANHETQMALNALAAGASAP
ncbi:MAG: peptidoglycan-binding protein [Clostridia bacterium]|nr:peptidoglycan-binding protein [Clostridia bacterium]